MARKTTGKKSTGGAGSGAGDDADTTRENALQTDGADKTPIDDQPPISGQAAPEVKPDPAELPEARDADASSTDASSTEPPPQTDPQADEVAQAEHAAAEDTTPDGAAGDADRAAPASDPVDTAPTAQNAADPGADETGPDAPADTQARGASASAAEPPAMSEPPLAAAPPPASPPPAKGGFFPLLLGGIVAGGLGYGVHSYLTGSIEDPSAEIAALQQEVNDLRAALADIPPPSDLSGLEGDVTDLRESLAAVDVSGEVTAAMDALRAEFAASDEVDRDTQVTARLNALARDLSQANDGLSQTTEQLGELNDALSERDARLDALHEEIAAVREIAEHRVAEAEAEIDTTLARAGLDLMRAALDTGAPYPEALTLLQDAAVTVPDALAAPAAQGVQTVEMLQDSFPAAARTALRSAYQEDSSGGAGARLENFFRSQLGVRSTAPREGNDPDAVLSRAGAMIAEGDLDGTLAELEALPDPAQAALAPWRNAAQARQDAQAAFDEFAMTVTNQ